MSSGEEILSEWKWTFWSWQWKIKDNRSCAYRPQNLTFLCLIRVFSPWGETALNCLLFYCEASAFPCWVMEGPVPSLHCNKPQQSSCDSLHLHISVLALCFCDINMNKQAFNVRFYEKHEISEICFWSFWQLLHDFSTKANHASLKHANQCFYKKEA